MTDFESQPLCELEICAGDIASAIAAAAAGADRVELCSALPLGGLTPPLSTISLTAPPALKIRRHVLLRPRPGDFLYTEDEMKAMIADIRSPLLSDVDGIVIGVLKADGNVDTENTRRLMEEARQASGRNLSFTFHRAFDMTADPLAALDDVVSLGFDRILTSGCAPSAEQGIPMLRILNKRAAGNITIMAGGGINADNACRIMQLSGCRSLHASCSHIRTSNMTFRNPRAFMGDPDADEYTFSTTSAGKIRSLLAAMHNCAIDLKQKH